MDPYEGRVNMRSVVVSHRNFVAEIQQQDILKKVMDLGGNLAGYRFNEPAPDEALTIQGELYENASGWWLAYNQEQVKMTVGMLRPVHVAGLKAKAILRHYCCPSSFEDLQCLLDLYPDHVIEFSVYRYTLGDVSNRNTIIWEVRRY
jgi:hypothetical protein